MEHKVSQHKLEGGAQALVVQVPNAISGYFRSSARAGYRFCKPSHYEVPHLLEHLAFEGNKTYPDPLKFKTTIELLGAGYNASTGIDSVNYWFVAGNEKLGEITGIGLTQILEPLFKPERVDQQKEVIVNELSRSLDNDTRKRTYTNYHAIFPRVNPRFEDRIRIVKGIKASDVSDFYKQTYGAKNLRFVLAGDHTPKQWEQILAKLNRGLAKHPQGTAMQFDPLEPSDYRRKILIESSHVPSVQHFLMRFGDPVYDRDSEAPLDVLTGIYSSGLGSRMQMKAREKGLTYTFGSGATADVDMTDFRFSDKVPPDKLLPLFELALEELADLCSGNISEAEIARAVGFIVGGVKRSVETAPQLASGYAGYFLRDEPLKSPQEFIEEIQATNAQSIKKAAQKYLRSDNWVLTLVGSGLKDQTGKFQDAIDRYFPPTRNK